MQSFKDFLAEEHIKRIPNFKDVGEAVEFYKKAETKAGKEGKRDELLKLLQDADAKDKRGEGSKDHHDHKKEVRHHLEQLAKIIVESEHVKRVPEFKDVGEAIKFYEKAETKAGKEKRRDEVIALLRKADEKDKKGEGSKDHADHKKEVRHHLEELAELIRP